MPKIQGLSKSAAIYRQASKPQFSCAQCKFMGPRLAFGGCRFVRGVIRASGTCDEFTPRQQGNGERPR